MSGNTLGRVLKIGTQVKHGMCGSPVMIRAYRIVWIAFCKTCQEEVRYEAFTT